MSERRYFYYIPDDYYYDLHPETILENMRMLLRIYLYYEPNFELTEKEKVIDIVKDLYFIGFAVDRMNQSSYFPSDVPILYLENVGYLLEKHPTCLSYTYGWCFDFLVKKIESLEEDPDKINSFVFFLNLGEVNSVQLFPSVEKIEFFGLDLPKVHTVLQFALDDLDMLLADQSIWDATELHEISSLHRDLKFIESFIKVDQQKVNHQDIIPNLVIHTFLAVATLLDSLDSYIHRNMFIKKEKKKPIEYLRFLGRVPYVVYVVEKIRYVTQVFDVPSQCQSSFTESSSIKYAAGFTREEKRRISFEADAREFEDGLIEGPKQLQVIPIVGMELQGNPEQVFDVPSQCENPSDECSSNGSNAGFTINKMKMIGFGDETRQFEDRLLGGRKKLLVIPIVGMPGIGKTTLVNQLFNDFKIVHHFHVRGWTSVSHSYKRRKLLCEILGSLISCSDPVFAMSDEDMGEKLYNCLKENRYLLVIDDVWDIGAWNEVEMYFPDDHNSSRVLMISRIADIFSSVRSVTRPYRMHLLPQHVTRDLCKSILFYEDMITKTEKEKPVENLPFLEHEPYVAYALKKTRYAPQVFDDPSQCESSSDESRYEKYIGYTREEMKTFGFEDKTREFEDRLIGGWRRLQVMPTVGMEQGNSQQVFDVPSQCESSIAENSSNENDVVFTRAEMKMTGSEDKTREIEDRSNAGRRIPIVGTELQGNPQQVFDVPSQCESSSAEKSSIENDAGFTREEMKMIGFEDETKEFEDRLIGGWKQLQVIPIVGMAGIGKTTFVNQLFNDFKIVRHFHIRGWTSVSQSYQRRKLLCEILGSLISFSDPVFASSDDELLGRKLYKCLKGNRYLIVIDDIWDIGAWNEVEMYFPNDGNSSRILMISRIADILPHKTSDSIRPVTPPYTLRFLTQGEGWDLFKSKLFYEDTIAEELIETGRKIVAKCKGLPLAIVVIAGFLAKEVKTPEYWRQVAENIGSSIHNNYEQLLGALALSYNHLSDELKSCFLYLGSFPEDHEISSRRLVRAWIAEGFIPRTTKKRLEDLAEENLMNLVSRSLLIVARRSSDGGIKSCKVHDALRDLCQSKATERKTVQLVCKCRLIGTITVEVCHKCNFSSCQYFHFYDMHFSDKSAIFNKQTLLEYKFLRTLNLRHIILDSFPEEILELVHLRFLALCVDRITSFPSSIYQLWNLENFILDGDKGSKIDLTLDLLEMVRLRHFETSQELVCNDDSWREHGMYGCIPPESKILYNLQSISRLSPSGHVDILLAKTPNLRRLGLCLTFSNDRELSNFPQLSSLDKLEKLKFEYHTLGMVPFSIPSLNKLPMCLKKLTLVGSHVKWAEMTTLALLPNLEVLKIKDNFFSGPVWETTEDSFPCLRFLKLSHMDLQHWISCSSHFPRLEHLVLNGCLDLEEIPSEIGEIPTMRNIEVYRSSNSAMESALRIQESQCDDYLKVFISHHFQEY